MGFPEAHSAAQESVGISNETENRDADHAPESGVRESDAAAAITELEKLEKFKFKGEEYTPKELERAVMRMKDYTQRTQKFAEERKAFESQSKYYENLHHDIENCRRDPSLVQQFINVYPEKFHQALKDALNRDSGSSQTQSQSQQQQRPQVDIDLMSRLTSVEKFYHEQQVKTAEQEIKANIDRFSKRYPDAIEEMVIARAYEAHNRGEQISPGQWENFFKEVDGQMKSHLKAKYGDMVKKQTQANDRAKGDAAGGGIPGRAPPKFKSMKDVTAHAASVLSGRKG